MPKLKWLVYILKVEQQAASENINLTLQMFPMEPQEAQIQKSTLRAHQREVFQENIRKDEQKWAKTFDKGFVFIGQTSIKNSQVQAGIKDSGTITRMQLTKYNPLIRC